MKNAMSIAVVLSLCFVVIGWASWTGYVYHDSQKYLDHADVVSEPADGHTTSDNDGYYSLNITNGMQQGKHYDQVTAYVTINGQYHHGHHWVDAYYDNQVQKDNLNISLSPNDDE